MCQIVLIFENCHHNTDEIYSHKADSQLHKQADPILLIGLFVFRRLFKAALKAYCLKNT